MSLPDALECRSPDRCRTCEHFVRDACSLEAELEAALIALGAAPRPAIRVALALTDDRRGNVAIAAAALA